MKRREFLFSASTAPVVLVGAPAAPEPAPEEGFVSLFDGASLAGWSIRDGGGDDYLIRNGCIEGVPSASPQAWLRSDRQYENFDFRCEFFIEGWMEGGFYMHAPEHGRNSHAGTMIKLFRAPELAPFSNGAIFPLIQPLKAIVKNRGDWNQFRVLMDWPKLRVWMNGEPVQDMNMSTEPELRYRLRRGYLGLTALATTLRFRNLRIRALPDKDRWEPLFVADRNLEKWTVVPEYPTSKPKWTAKDGVLRGEGTGNLVTKEQYRDFELTAYVRAQSGMNSGVFFRTDGKGLAARYYEIQIFNVPDAHMITGSLYGLQRGPYPHVLDEEWFPFQLVVKGDHCVTRVNGDTVTDYTGLENFDAGHIELQSHRDNRWVEFKQVQLKRL